MKVALIPPDSPLWEAFLRDADHDFYHLPAYAALCAKRDGGHAFALYADNAGRRMILPLVVRPITGELRDAASPYGYPGPLIAGTADQAFLAEAFDAAREELARHGIVSLFVRGHPLLGPLLEARDATVVDHGLTLSADLSCSLDELWTRTMSGHRSEISRAIRAGHRVYMDDRFEHFAAFVRIYRQTMERLNAASSYMFDEDYFAGLRQALDARLHLCVVEIGGVIAGAGLFVGTCGLVQYHLSGTDPRFMRDRPTKLMLHYVRTWAKERGFRRLHLGGGVGAGDDSLFRFKAGFATDRHPFRTLRIVCNDASYAALVRATHPEADPRDCSGFFPLYRKPA